MGNLWPIVSFFVNINLLFFLFCCCFSSTRSANFNADDATFIKGDDVPSSHSVRHYGVPRIDEFPCGRGPTELPKGDKVDSKIVGGRDAVKNSWPFMVALKVNNVMRCGGSLISPNKILTAAHCVEKESFFGFSQMTVSLGMHTVEKNDAQVTRRIIRVKIHNEFAFLAYTNVTTTNVNDIAILTLDDPVPYSTAISPVCLPPANANPDQYAGRDAAAIGWGRLQEGGTSSNVLRETTLRITTYAECKAVYPSLLTSMLCTYSPGKDTCQGDSGSPIIIKSPSGVWTQVAIVSYGLGCARPAIPGVNTRVTAFSEWIEKYAK